MTEIDHVRSLSAAHVSPGLWSLQRLQNRGATYPGLTLTRLRYAFRVSHPPDALFPPKPFRPISDGNAPGISPFEGFPSRGMDSVSRPTLPAWRWLKRTRRAHGRRCPRSPPGSCTPRKSVASFAASSGCGSSLPWGFRPSRGVSLTSTAPLVTGASSHGLRSGRRRTAHRLRSSGVSVEESLEVLRRELRPSWGLSTSSRQAGCRWPNRSLMTLVRENNPCAANGQSNSLRIEIFICF
jgi:hypothetical protein